MVVELPSWPDVCHEVTARIDELIARLSTPPREDLTSRQRLGRALGLTHIRRARQTLNASAAGTWLPGGEPRVDGIRELLEQGEYLDPDDIDWPQDP